MVISGLANPLYIKLLSSLSHVSLFSFYSTLFLPASIYYNVICVWLYLVHIEWIYDQNIKKIYYILLFNNDNDDNDDDDGYVRMIILSTIFKNNKTRFFCLFLFLREKCMFFFIWYAWMVWVCTTAQCCGCEFILSQLDLCFNFCVSFSIYVYLLTFRH